MHDEYVMKSKGRNYSCVQYDTSSMINFIVSVGQVHWEIRISMREKNCNQNKAVIIFVPLSVDFCVWKKSENIK
jgi:hypothetical protein